MLIVKMICLAIGTVLAVLFILLTMRGKKEDWRIEGVPEKEFSDKELWAAGFAMQQMPMFSMDSAVGKKMISASAILHPENGGRQTGGSFPTGRKKRGTLWHLRSACRTVRAAPHFQGGV